MFTNSLLLESTGTPASQIKITKMWEEYNYWYCTLQSSKDNPSSNFSMDGIVSKNGIKYVLLSLPPPFSTSTEKQYSVLKIIDANSLQLIETDTIEDMSDELSSAVSESRIKKSNALKMCFGGVVERIN